MFRPSRLALSLIISAICIFGGGSANAQDYPNKVIKIVVAQTPGNQQDLVARIMASEMSKSLGQPIIVENKAGATSIIGYEYVAKQAPADGYTILLSVIANPAIFPLTYKDLRFDPVQDLPPVLGFAEGKLVLASPAAAPWKTFNELVANAKANPGKLNYGASSPTVRLLTETLIRNIGLNIVHVPFSATAGNVNALVVGDTQMTFFPDSQAIALGDKVRVLAVTGEQRTPAFPDVPTFAELGHPEIWGISYSLNVRAGTPKAVIDKLYAAASRALQQPEAKAGFAKLQLSIIVKTPEAAAKSTAEQSKVFADIAKKIGMQPE